MSASRRNRYHSGSEASNIHRECTVKYRFVTEPFKSIDLGVVSKLTSAVVSPTLHTSQSAKSTGVLIPDGNRRDPRSEADYIHWWSIETINPFAVAEFANAVIAPALDAS